MKIYVGRLVARCRHCDGIDWRLVRDARSFNLDSELVCTDCNATETYADLVLQAPPDEAPVQRNHGRDADPAPSALLGRRSRSRG